MTCLSLYVIRSVSQEGETAKLLSNLEGLVYIAVQVKHEQFGSCRDFEVCTVMFLRDLFYVVLQLQLCLRKLLHLSEANRIAL